MLEFLKKNYIGVDLFYNQIRVVDYKEGIIYDNSINSLYEGFVEKLKSDKIKYQLDNFKYIYHIDTIYLFFKDLIKIINPKFAKPIIILSVPSEIKHSNFGDLWINSIENTLLECNIDSLILVESIICAAYSLEIPFTKPKYNNLYSKFIIVHQTAKATATGVLFKNNIHNTKIINKIPKDIDLEEIISSINFILKDSSFTPTEVMDKNLTDSEKEILTRSWQSQFEKVIHIVAPIELCKKLDSTINDYFDDFKINCIENYDESIIKGLEKILIEINSKFNE